MRLVPNVHFYLSLHSQIYLGVLWAHIIGVKMTAYDLEWYRGNLRICILFVGIGRLLCHSPKNVSCNFRAFLESSFFNNWLLFTINASWIKYDFPFYISLQMDACTADVNFVKYSSHLLILCRSVLGLKYHTESTRTSSLIRPVSFSQRVDDVCAWIYLVIIVTTPFICVSTLIPLRRSRLSRPRIYFRLSHITF